MTKKLVLIISNLKKDIQESKGRGFFDLDKLVSSDFSSLKTGTKEIKRIKEFKDLNIAELPIGIKDDEELYTVICHFALLEEQKTFLNYESTIADKIGMKISNYPNTNKGIDDEVIEDCINMKNLFDYFSENIGEPIDTSKINFIPKTLTKTQKDVVKLILNGFSQAEICKKLKKDKGNLNRIIKRIHLAIIEENHLQNQSDLN